MAAKVDRPQGEWRESLVEQVGFLRASCAALDRGELAEAKRIAATIRVLLHDTRNSTSLMTHLRQKDRIKVTTVCTRFDDSILPGQSVLAFISTNLGNAWYVPHSFAEPPRHGPRSVKLEEWWTEPVGFDAERRTFSRRQLVLTLANQDGGTHLDEKVDELYFDVSRLNALGWTVHHEGEPEGSPGVPLPNPVPAWVRQIAHDLLVTIQSFRRRFGIEEFVVPTPTVQDWCGESVARVAQGVRVYLRGPRVRMSSLEMPVTASAWVHSSDGAWVRRRG